MSVSRKRRVLGAAILLILLIIGVFGVEILAALQGPLVPFRNPSRKPRDFGHRGAPLVYVVLGDSTGAGQGGDYQQGIAVATARHLSKRYHVILINLAVSGATCHDIVLTQLDRACALKPDVVLISAGANDATHFRSSDAVYEDLSTICRRLVAAHCETRIVLTGCPDLGSVPRFAQPLRWFAGTQTARINRAMYQVEEEYQVDSASIAKNTGKTFERDPSLFAEDHFHPNTRGYKVWIPFLNHALDLAVHGSLGNCYGPPVHS